MQRTPSLRLSVCVHFLRLKVILYLDTRLTTDTTYTLLIDKHTQHPHRWADVWSVLEVLTLSHRCNPSVRLRQDVNKAFKSTPQNNWAVSQAKTWICSTNKQQQCDWCTWSLFEVRLSTERQTDSQWFSPGRTAKCEILFKSSLLSLLTEVEQSDQAAWTLTSGDCMIISVCATICVSLPQHAFSSLFSVPDSSQFQITLLFTPDTINVSVY